MRYLGVDLGDKRTGLAAGDSITRTAVPLNLVEVPIERRGGEDLLDAIATACRDLLGDAPGELVIGLPLNMDGTEGDRAKLSRAFGTRLADRTGRTIHLHDERKTSEKANEKMARSGLTHKQKKLRRDALAAAVMLSDFLERHVGPSLGSSLWPDRPDETPRATGPTGWGPRPTGPTGQTSPPAGSPGRGDAPSDFPSGEPSAGPGE